LKKSKIETAETRRRIVSSASDAFLKQGIAATGIADIMINAGLTQGGFYRHFESKEQLIAESIQVAFIRLIEMFETVVAEKQPQEAIENIVSIYLDQARIENFPYLCPLANLVTELRHSDKQIKAVARDGYYRLTGLFATQTEKLKLHRPVAVASAIVSTLVGAVALSRLESDARVAESILESARNAVRILASELPPGS
jgi:TetR/AcrR family transcriptional regulator, transcriptional repressor for nem operon